MYAPLSSVSVKIIGVSLSVEGDVRSSSSEALAMWQVILSRLALALLIAWAILVGAPRIADALAALPESPRFFVQYAMGIAAIALLLLDLLASVRHHVKKAPGERAGSDDPVNVASVLTRIAIWYGSIALLFAIFFLMDSKSVAQDKRPLSYERPAQRPSAAPR